MTNLNLNKHNENDKTEKIEITEEIERVEIVDNDKTEVIGTEYIYEEPTEDDFAAIEEEIDEKEKQQPKHNKIHKRKVKMSDTKKYILIGIGMIVAFIIGMIILAILIFSVGIFDPWKGDRADEYEPNTMHVAQRQRAYTDIYNLDEDSEYLDKINIVTDDDYAEIENLARDVDTARNDMARAILMLENAENSEFGYELTDINDVEIYSDCQEIIDRIRARIAKATTVYCDSMIKEYKFDEDNTDYTRSDLATMWLELNYTVYKVEMMQNYSVFTEEQANHLIEKLEAEKTTINDKYTNFKQYQKDAAKLKAEKKKAAEEEAVAE